MANSLLSAGPIRRAAVLLTAVLACGCGRQQAAAPRPARLTTAQETAAREFAKLLDRKFDQVEETAAILETVQDDAASQRAARDKLLALSVQMDVVRRQVEREQPADPAVVLAAYALVQHRGQRAYEKLTAQVRRINGLPGGPDFFEKELRPLLPTAEGR